MNRVSKRIRQAAKRNVFAYKRFPGWYEDQFDKFDVYVENEGPIGPRRLALTKRQAANLAYSISISKKTKIIVIASLENSDTIKSFNPL